MSDLTLLHDEARRVLGPEAQVTYGQDNGEHFASAHVEGGAELNVWGPNPLDTLLLCLRALPEAS